MADNLGQQLVDLGKGALGDFAKGLGDTLNPRGEDNDRAEAAQRFDWRMVGLIVGAMVGVVVLLKFLRR